MPRQIGRNQHKGFMNHAQTMQMCALAATTIDAEIAASTTGRLENLKDVVYDALFFNLPWWKNDWVDFPGFCDYDGTAARQGAWVCIRKFWSKQNPGKALRWEQDRKVQRPGSRSDDGVWYVISTWAEALPVVETTLDDNAARINNDLKSFETLLVGVRNGAILAAMQSSPEFIIMHYRLIEAATWLTELIERASAAELAALGWVDEDDALTAVEHRCGFPVPRRTGSLIKRSLWATYTAQRATVSP